MTDPVTQYATDAIAGRVIASRLVRLACARHVRDLKDGPARGLVWRPERAQEVIDFFAEVLCLPEETDASDDDADALTEASPFILQPWQQFIVGSLFGWYQRRGAGRASGLTRRFHIAYIEASKGSGKTPCAAGMLIYMMVADGERGAQCFTAAVTKEQARLAFADAEKMVKASPHLSALIDQKVSNLAVLATGSFIRPISSEKRGLDGKRVHGAVVDELHEHPTAIVAQKIRAGIKGRRNALIMFPTNSGVDRESICWQYHDYSRQVLEQTLTNDAWFAFVCHLDACEACAAKGRTQPEDDCPACDDWRVEGPHWLKANPNLGVSVPWQYLRDQVREAVSMPSQRNMVRRLNFCQWTQVHDVWIAAEAWRRCATTFEPDALDGRECYIGVDLSDKIDLSAVVLLFPRPLPATAHAPVSPEAAERIDCAFDVVPHFWMPENSLEKRGREDHIPYPEWVESGHITATHGDLIDHDAIVDFLIDCDSCYRVMGVGFDQAGATAAVTRLQRHFGDERVIEIPQSFRHLSEPSKMFEALVVSGHLAHDGNPAMAMCVANLAIDANRWGEIRPVKLGQRKRIDGGVACIDAIKVRQLLSQVGDLDSDASDFYAQHGARGA